MSFANTVESQILDKEFGATDYTPPATLYAALFTTMPADDGTGAVEANYGSFARVAVTNNATNFPSANPKVNANTITFATATGAQTGQIKGMGWYSASSGGILRSYGWLCDQLQSMAIGVPSSDTVYCAAAHGWIADTKVIVWAPAGVSLPGGLSAGTEYFVRSPSGAALQLAATAGGAAIDLTSDGGLIIARSRFTVVNIGDTPSFAASGFSMTQD